MLNRSCQNHRHLILLLIALAIFTLAPGLTVAAQASNATPASTAGPLILFEAIDPDTFAFSLGTMNEDGSNATTIVESGALEAKHPSWSPDGTSIAFIDNIDGSIWTANADGSSQTQVLACKNSCTILDYPTWSPDGQQIVFVSYQTVGDNPPESSAVVILDLASGDQTTVTEATYPQIVDTPQYSPDGQTILFAMNEMDEEFYQTGSALATVPVTGGDVTWLTDFSLFAYYPSWNTQTGQILFGQEPILWTNLDDRLTRPLNLWVINADGSNLTQITDVPESMRIVQPAWSPDGAHIIATQSDDTGGGLVWVDPATGKWKRIGPDNYKYASVQPVPDSAS